MVKRGPWFYVDSVPEPKLIRRVELGPGNPVVEAWFYADGSLTIGDVQYGRQIGGINLGPELAEKLRRALREEEPRG